MTLIDRIVDIKITRNTKGVQREEFSTILVIGSATDSDLIKEYFSAAEVATDYSTSSEEYLIATRIFGQEISVSKILIGQTKAGESLVDAYTRIAQTYTFYALIIADKVDITLEALMAVAAAVEADEQPRILSLMEIDLAGLTLTAAVKAANYSRTYVSYNSLTDAAKVNYMNAAWLGDALPNDPGTINWAFRTLTGIVADTPISGGLTNAKIAAIEAQNGNYYTTVGGRDGTFFGTMGSGEYIDIIYGIDWLENAMQLNIANIYFTAPKIPYTAQGISLIETGIRATLELGRTRGLISTYTVTTPDINNVSFDDKAARQLKGVSFTAVFQGAINKVVIKGFVTL